MHIRNADTPLQYTGPKYFWERKIVEKIFNFMLGSEDVAIVTKDIDAHELRNNDKKFLVCAPSLLQTLKMLINPDIFVGEAYQHGYWFIKKGELYQIMEYFLNRQDARFVKYFEFLSKSKGIKFFLSQIFFVKYFTRKVKLHYDITPYIYETILDKNLLYTCAIFESADQNLDDAQINKVNVLFDRLDLSSGKCRLLEIGCGWGAFGRLLLEKYPKSTYTGLSISNAQINYARAKLSGNQSERIDYLLEDYLDYQPEKTFDRLLVVGMMEHVGLSHYHMFMKRISGFLSSHGKCVIHTILSESPDVRSSQWIQKYIFPGGYSPSLSEITKAVEGTELEITNIHAYDASHYRRTITAWRNRLEENWDSCAKKLSTLGLKELDIDYVYRTWMFYLSSVQIMFHPNVMRSRICHVELKKR